MGARCRSFRFLQAPDDPDDYLPVGRSHKVWGLCSNRVVRKGERCQECQDALITCPSVPVRLALAREVGQDLTVLEALTTDNDMAVAAAASKALRNGDSGGLFDVGVRP
ncbi:MAG: hypothetical protein B7X32_04870 [Microbacterium sp. 13-71-7]|jgi:hypothetical protein|nr:MAG: hypothetical protein B7X32_04870 [Microbacterium sp. 13-71-7]